MTDAGEIVDPCCTDRPEGVERMVRFGYYLSMAANMLRADAVEALVDADYLDPADVLREASAWCYGPGRDIAVAFAHAEAQGATEPDDPSDSGSFVERP